MGKQQINDISSQIPTKREYWIDVLRAFACIMVLFCHSPQLYVNQPGQVLMPINNYYGMAWGPVLFFMISGACILNKEQTAFQFLRKRFSRILIPTIIWSVVYVIMECKVWHTQPEQAIWGKILQIPFEPQYGLMWFMYVLISIYLMTPLLSVWLNRCGKRELHFYLLLWGLTLLLPYLEQFGININSVVKPNGMLYYMSGYLWIAVLGYYCRRYGFITTLRWWHILLAVIVLLSPLYILIIKYFMGTTITTSRSVDSVATTALAFLFFRNIHMKGHFTRPITLISKYSFGIYLIHMLIMYPFRIWIAQFNLNYFIQIPFTVVVVGVITFFITAIMSKIPYSKYIIG